MSRWVASSNTFGKGKGEDRTIAAACVQQSLVPKDQILCDLVYLFENVLRCYKPALLAEHVPASLMPAQQGTQQSELPTRGPRLAFPTSQLYKLFSGKYPVPTEWCCISEDARLQ